MAELYGSNGANGMTNGVHVRPSETPRLDVDALYGGARFLLLGGTGFLGKIFWVLLLDRFGGNPGGTPPGPPGIERIYLMVRSSKDKTSEQRFTEILGNDALRPLRDKHGDGFEAFVRSKIVPIDGDMSRPLCGVDPKLAAEIAGTLDAVVNVAGVVDFNPPLDESIEANAFGAKNLVALAHALGDAPIFHTSTTMVVGDRLGAIVEEDPMVHPFPRSDELGAGIWNPEREVDECLELCAQARHRCEDAFRQSDFAEKAKKALAARGEPSDGPAFTAELAKVKRKFIKDQLVTAGRDRAAHWGWPNIYTYTKSIGEQIISRAGLPFTIVRPASCESTHHFPFRGYNEGIGTSAPFIFLALKGHVQFPAADDVLLEFIPSDYVCVGMALALAELLEGTAKPIYQYAVGEVNPCSSARFAELMGLYKRRLYQKSSKGNPIVNFLQAHIEPVAVTTDRLEVIGPKAVAKMGHKLAKALRGFGPLAPAARAIESYAAQEHKIGEMLDLFAPFTTIQKGPFSAANTRSAFARLTAADKARLPWEPEKLDWPDYWMTAHMPAIESRVIPEIEKRMKKELAPLAAHETLLTLLDQMARRHQVAVALSHVEDAGLTRVTYDDLRARAASTAARLSLAGVGKGDRVVLMSHNHPDWAVAYFGILWAGATAVPVDPAFSHDAFSRIVHESGARAVVWDGKVKERLLAEGAAPSVPGLDVHEATEEDAALAPPPAAIGPDDVASLLYTSGTTAAPKGVMLTHANFTSLIAGLAPLFPLQPGDRALSVLPLHHTFEFTCGLLLPLSRGGRVVYIGEVTPERLGRGLELGRVTAMVGVPALWQLLERRILTQVKAKGPIAETAFNLGTELNRFLGDKIGVDVGRALFGSVHESLGGKVKYLISGGAALPHGTHKLFAGLGLPLVEGYGLTEAAPVLTVTRGKSRAGQVGKAVPGVEVTIADPNETGVGEVLAKGPNVMAGYTDAQATAAAIDADGWLHTGDLGKIDKHGRLSIVGRLKDVIVTATGENVHPDDLEREIGQVEHIAELAIVGVEARGAERVGCLAVPADTHGLERGARNERAIKSLRAAVGKLPFGKQPAILHLYDAPLPRTATRKVKRTEVKEILSRMVLATAPSSGGDGKTSPVRVAIGAIRARPPETLAGDATLHDDLGFDSLALSELLVALEAKFGTIDPASLQACGTVAEVEALVGTPRETLRPKPKATAPADEGERIVLPREVQDAGKRFIGKLQDAFYGRLMNARVYGRAHIPHNRNTIVVANHGSHLDMGFVRHALGKYGEDIVSLAAQDYFFDKSPLRRAFFENLTNLRAIDRKGGLRASERQAAEILAEGRTMLIFPEGTRSPDGQIHDFKPILGHLALTYGVDILPVHIAGTRESMPKGSRLPTSRDIVARIGVPLTVDELRRLTSGMTPADASREVSRLAHQAVVALGSGNMLDLTELAREDVGGPKSKRKEKEHPLVTLFAELETKFKPGKVDKPISFYFTLGGDALAKWTVKVDPKSCEIKVGKPEGSAADCVLKTSPEIFERIVRDAYTPGPAEFLSGAIKSNDVELLLTFQRAFELG